MYGTAATTARRSLAVRFHDCGTQSWIREQAPCIWRDHTDVHFLNVPLGDLEHAGSWTDPAVVAGWLTRMRTGRSVPPPVVCRTGTGKLYLRDGNHRYLAMREFFQDDVRATVRVALMVPRPGFHFRYRWFGSYGTYLLEPQSIARRLSALRRCRRQEPSQPSLGRTLVLVAHPDDETACAGLLQRLPDPLVVYASNGAPADEFFWKMHGSPHAYSLLRRKEALNALQAIGISQAEFLNDRREMRFRDQELHLSLEPLLEAASAVLHRYGPESILVPAYEGGHPDHDVCSFLGHVLGSSFGVPVWEIPLYHRSPEGALVCGRFHTHYGTELSLELDRRELRARDAMVASYSSQQDLGQYLTSSVEHYRPQPHYNYAHPPHRGRLNYQVWQWPISPSDVCRCFRQCLELDPANSQHESEVSCAPPTESTSTSKTGLQ